MKKHNVPFPPSLNVQYAVRCKKEQAHRCPAHGQGVIDSGHGALLSVLWFMFQNVLLGRPAGLTAVLSFTVYCYLTV